jgi:hypothetical protein
MKAQSNKLWLLACAVGVAAPAVVSVAALADEVFTATAAVTLPGGQSIGTFDISYVTKGHYYLGDRTNAAVDVVDTSTNSVTQQIGKGQFAGATGNNNTSGPDGVLVFHNQVWAGDGDSTVKVFNATTGASITTVHTGPATDLRADELCHDSRDGLVMVANNAASPWPFGTIITTDTFATTRITFDGTNNTPKATNGAEQCQWSHRTGKFYISIPEINGPGDNSVAGGVAVIDPKTKKVETTFVISHNDCAGPQGMALGPDHQMLLGCNGASGDGQFSTVVIDERDGHVIKVLNNQSGADEVWFNPGDDHYFLARSSAAGPAAGGNQLLGVVDAKGLTQDPSAVTNAAGKGNVHSVAADPENNKVFVPIPKTATAKVCSSAGGTDAVGCIAVFTSPNDRDCFAEGSPVIHVSDEGDEDHMRESCHHHED